MKKVIVITGASSGLGRALAIGLAREGGVKLALTARRKGSLEETARECRKYKTQVMVIRADITVESQVEAMTQMIIKKWGKVDVWVNNAGVCMWGSVEETPSEAMKQVMETNLFGYVHGIKNVLPQMRKQGKGTIINILATEALAAAPMLSAYTASKFAMRGITKSLRAEVRDPNINICEVYPSELNTEMYKEMANYSDTVPTIREGECPERTVKEVMKLMNNPREVLILGDLVGVNKLVYQHIPNWWERIMAFVSRKRPELTRKIGEGDGNLYLPSVYFGY